VIDDVKFEHFSATAEEAPAAIVLHLRGNADQVVRDALRELLAQLREEASRVSASEMIVDVRDLYFMNSSCLSVVVQWISGLVKAGSGACRVRFRCNANLRWQRRSLQAIATLGGALVTID
jgi:anti-anti-sigma factor